MAVTIVHKFLEGVVMRKIIAITLIFFFLVSCASKGQVATVAPTTTPTVPPTATSTVLIPTSTETPVPTMTPSPTEEVRIGLGVSRSDGARMFQVFEFTFELKKDDAGKEAYIGNISDNLAEIRLYGPEADLNQAVLVVRVPQPPTQNQSARTVIYLSTMLTVFASDWEEGTAWLNTSLNKIGESTAEFGDKQAILNLTPSNGLMTVEFTIRGVIVK